jgi:hypothetical protein
MGRLLISAMVILMLVGASLAAAQDKTTHTATKAEVAAMLKQAQVGLEDAVHRALTKNQARQFKSNCIRSNKRWPGKSRFWRVETSRTSMSMCRMEAFSQPCPPLTANLASDRPLR